MNPLPPNADELVSAYLDGQAAPDEIVIVESSPELLQRVEELRSLSGALAAPMAAPPAQKRMHLGAALDLFDQLVDDGEFANATGQSFAASPASVGETTALGGSVDLDDSVADAPVVSLQSARDRRRPRRFNSGVIAAAVAALLLVVGLAALDFGRGTSSDDVAGSETEAIAADDGSDSGDDSADTAMMGADEAMDDTESDSAAAAGSERAAEPRPEGLAEAAPPAAVEEALDDADQADDAESSVLELEAAEEDSAGETFAADAEPLQYDPFLGDYPDVDELVEELETFTDDDLVARTAALEPGLFPGCQPEVAELRDVESLTLVGQALIDERPVEVHAFDPGRTGRSATGNLDVLVVDAGDCSPIVTIE